jgi:hypothetical protein
MLVLTILHNTYYSQEYFTFISELTQLITIDDFCQPHKPYPLIGDDHSDQWAPSSIMMLRGSHIVQT